MKTDKLKELYTVYGLEKEDVYQHKHYSIITRSGIDKIQAKAGIIIEYEAVKVEPEFCVVKAKALKGEAGIETFGSAKYGSKNWDASKNNGKGGWNETGNTSTWYVMEMAEKRAMSRAVLKVTGFYELGVFGEDESEDFNKNNAAKEVPKEEDVKPTLTDAQFNIAKNSNEKGIKATLSKMNMTPEQRKALTLIIDLDGDK